jgi:hypothetical protein
LVVVVVVLLLCVCVCHQRLRIDGVRTNGIETVLVCLAIRTVIVMIMQRWVVPLRCRCHRCHHRRGIIAGLQTIVSMTHMHRMKTGVEGQRGPIETIVLATLQVAAAAAVEVEVDVSRVDKQGISPSFARATHRRPVTVVSAAVAAGVGAGAVAVAVAAHPKHSIAVGFRVRFLEQAVGVGTGTDAPGCTRVTRRPIVRPV